MRIIWSLEEILDRYWTKQIGYLEESVLSVQYLFPSYTRVLYCSEYILEYLGTQWINRLFDEVNILDYSIFPSISPQVFWASSKFRALYKEESSCIFLDNDFKIKEPFLTKLDKTKICTNFRENTVGLYPNSFDPIVKELHLPWRIRESAFNTSFMYFPDKFIMHSYVETALVCMENISKYSIYNDTYMLFCEQMLLENFIYAFQVPYQCLSKDVWDIKSQTWLENEESEGIFSNKEKEYYYTHIGPKK